MKKLKIVKNDFEGSRDYCPYTLFAPSSVFYEMLKGIPINGLKDYNKPFKEFHQSTM